MILTSTTEPVAYRVPWRAEDPTAPRFLFRSGSVIERCQMEAELSGIHNAGRVSGYELRQASRRGIEALFAGDPEFDRMIELVEAEALPDAPPTSEDDKLLLAELHKLLNDNWPDYRDLIAQANRRRELAPIVALRRFCVGVEGSDVRGNPIVFARGRDGMVAEATLVAIDSVELMVAGNHCYGLQYGLAESAEKNSGPPPASGADPATSPSAGTSRAAGKSKATGGKKTRGSRRRPGRSPSSTSTSTLAATPLP
jgi:hypothetical protein